MANSRAASASGNARPMQMKLGVQRRETPIGSALARYSEIEEPVDRREHAVHAWRQRAS
jgi:hypothetical protein